MNRGSYQDGLTGVHADVKRVEAGSRQHYLADREGFVLDLTGDSGAALMRVKNGGDNRSDVWVPAGGASGWV